MKASILAVVLVFTTGPMAYGFGHGWYGCCRPVLVVPIAPIVVAPVVVAPVVLQPMAGSWQATWGRTGLLGLRYGWATRFVPTVAAVSTVPPPAPAPEN